MKKITPFFLFVLLASSIQAQVTASYATGFDNTTDQAGWTEYRKGSIDPFYFWNFSPGAPYSAPNSLAHNYPVGGSQVTRDWFVSPAFNFPNGAVIDSIRYAFSGFGLPNTGDTVALYLLDGNQDPDLATKTLLRFYSDSNYQNDGVWRLDTNLIVPPASGAAHLAFLYITTNNWLDVKFDNLKLTGNQFTAMKEFNTSLILYPNPAADVIYLQSGNARDLVRRLELHDISGRMVRQFQADSRALELSGISAGTYFLQIVTADGKRSEKVIIR